MDLQRNAWEGAPWDLGKRGHFVTLDNFSLPKCRGWVEEAGKSGGKKVGTYTSVFEGMSGKWAKYSGYVCKLGISVQKFKQTEKQEVRIQNRPIQAAVGGEKCWLGLPNPNPNSYP